VAKLKPDDIDPQKGLIRIKDSTGRNNRYTLKSDNALKILKAYFKENRPTKWLFERAQKDRHIL